MPALFIIALTLGQLTQTPPVFFAPLSSFEIEPVGRAWISLAQSNDVVAWADRRKDGFRPNTGPSLYLARFVRSTTRFERDAGLLVVETDPALASVMADPMYASTPSGSALVWTRIESDGGWILEGKTNTTPGSLSFSANSIGLSGSIGVRPGPTRLATSGTTFLAAWAAPTGIGLKVFMPASVGAIPAFAALTGPFRDFSIGADKNGGFAVAWIEAVTGEVKVATLSATGVVSTAVQARSSGPWARVELVDALTLTVVLQDDAGTWTHSERIGNLWTQFNTSTPAEPSPPVVSTAVGNSRFSVSQPAGQPVPSAQWQTSLTPTPWPEVASVRMLSGGDFRAVALEDPLRARLIQTAAGSPLIALTSVSAATIAGAQRSPAIGWSAADQTFLVLWDESESASDTSITTALLGIDAGPSRLSPVVRSRGTDPRLLVAPNGSLTVMSSVGPSVAASLEPVTQTRPLVEVGARSRPGNPALQRARQGNAQLLLWGPNTREVWLTSSSSGLMLPPAAPLPRCAALAGNRFFLGAVSASQQVSVLMLDDTTQAIVKQNLFITLDVEPQSSLCFTERPTNGDLVVAWRKGGQVLASTIDPTLTRIAPVYAQAHTPTEDPVVTSVPDGVFLAWAERGGVKGVLIPHDGGTSSNYQLSTVDAPRNVVIANSPEGDVGVAWEEFDSERDTLMVNARVLRARRTIRPPDRPDAGAGDAGAGDAGVGEGDAGTPDAGTPVGPEPLRPNYTFVPTCGCTSAVDGAVWLLALLALTRRAERRWRVPYPQ